MRGFLESLSIYVAYIQTTEHQDKKKMMHTMMMKLCLGASSATRHVIHSWDMLGIGVSIIEMHFVRLVYKNNSTNVDK